MCKNDWVVVLSHFLCDNDDKVIIESLLHMSIHMSAGTLGGGHTATSCCAYTDQERGGLIFWWQRLNSPL